ncbi:MAG: hypothetical protein Q4C05_03125 [Akkermansia sp.]|nr:hypothetical protein [Akkermansia sp.]
MNRTIIVSILVSGFFGFSNAQESPVPVQSPVMPTETEVKLEVSQEAKDIAKKLVELMKQINQITSEVKDKATADAAASKIEKLNEEGEAVSEKGQKIKEEIDLAMQEYATEILPIFMGMMQNMQRLQAEEFYQSEALKKSLMPEEAEILEEISEDMEEEGEVEEEPEEKESAEKE